jgi:hypothetical protein
MYQSSTRNNFLDILLDPTAIAILGSIALHAIIAASFPFLFHPEKPGKKADTGSVKVVELTPNELQRIPQAPPPVIPQTLPPVYQPSIPIAPAAPPRAPKISTAPQTIPSSPIRPSPKTTAKPVPTKGQTAKPQAKPSPPVFDPKISFEPNPLPTKVSAKPNPTKPAPPVSRTPTKPTKPTSPKPTQLPQDDKKFSEELQPSPAPGSGNTSQKPAAAPQPTGSPNSTPGTPSSGQPPSNGGNPNGVDPYNTKEATRQKIEEYLTRYKDLKLYPPKALAIKYPPGVTCSKVKQPPFIVLMVAFDKVPPGQESSVLGSATAPLLENEKPFISGDPSIKSNKKLLELATDAGFTDATAADQKRPEADKGRPVLYQYRVQLDPASCPN